MTDPEQPTTSGPVPPAESGRHAAAAPGIAGGGIAGGGIAGGGTAGGGTAGGGTAGGGDASAYPPPPPSAAGAPGGWATPPGGQAQPGGWGQPGGWAQPGGWPAPPEPPRSRALGLTALLIAAPLFVLSVIASIVVGTTAGPLSRHTSSSFAFSTDSLTPQQAAAFAPVGILMGVQLIVGTALGILALVLGIVAVATKRGRALGIVAIVIAAAAPIVSFAVYVGSLVATLPPA